MRKPPTTYAFNVERVRADLLSRVRVPDDLLQAAINTARAKLDAKETKFFTYRGEVIQREEVEAHSTQLAAADQIFSIAGVYARERERIETPAVALEIDPVTGAVRLLIGSQNGNELLPARAESTLVEGRQPELAPHVREESSFDGDDPVLVRKPGKMPQEVYDILFGDA